jgi:choline dehydrogenase-like flavoprotein
MTRSADVVIVGSGVAGSLVAVRLAHAGLKVLIR